MQACKNKQKICKYRLYKQLKAHIVRLKYVPKWSYFSR